MAAPAPNADGPEIRPLSRGKSKVLVLTLMVLAFLFAFGGMYIFYQNATDPEVQELREKVLQRQAEAEAAAAEAADSTNQP